MSRLFFADNDFQREYDRRKAKGYKRFIVAPDVNTSDSVRLTSKDRELLLVKDNEEDGKEADAYIFLCKEFGLANSYTNKALVSVIFLDNENMLVTLHKGRLCINYNGSPIEPCIGEENGKYKVENIKWVNAADIRSYAGRQGETGLFLQDLEVYYELSGMISDSAYYSFSIKPLHDQCKDLSCGHIEAYRIAKAEAEQKGVTLDVSTLLASTSLMPLEEDTDNDDLWLDEEDEEEM